MLGTMLMRVGPGMRFNEHTEEENGPLAFHHACKLGLEGIQEVKRAYRMPLVGNRATFRQRKLRELRCSEKKPRREAGA
jgi:hypothetical protein